MNNLKPSRIRTWIAFGIPLLAMLLSPTNAHALRQSVNINADYDTVWHKTLVGITQSIICHGCYINIVKKDKLTGHIVAEAKYPHKADAKFDIQLESIEYDQTHIDFDIRIDLYKQRQDALTQWLLPAKLPNIEKEYTEHFIHYIRHESTKEFIDPEGDVRVETELSASSTSSGEDVELSYTTFTSQSVTFRGYIRYPRVVGKQNRLIVENVDNNDKNKKDESYLVFGEVWDPIRSLPRVTFVMEDSAAADYLQPGDYIQAVDGEKILSYSHWGDLLKKKSPTKPTDFKIIRNKKELEFQITPYLGYTPWSHRKTDSSVLQFNFDTRFDERAGGMLITNTHDESHLKAGDIIQSVDNEPIESAAQWQVILNTLEEKDYTMVIRREETEETITLQPISHPLDIIIYNEDMSKKRMIPQTVNIAGKRFIKVVMQNFRFTIPNPGQYQIDPGHLYFAYDNWGLSVPYVIKKELLPLIIN